MTPTEYQTICDSLGLDRLESAAKLLGVSKRSARRLRDGEVAVPGPVDRLLRLLLATGINPRNAIMLTEPKTKVAPAPTSHSKTCKVCGSEFETADETATVCSETACQRERARKLKYAADYYAANRQRIAKRRSALNRSRTAARR